MDKGWMFAPALKATSDYERSFAKYANIKRGQEFQGYKDWPKVPYSE